MFLKSKKRKKALPAEEYVSSLYKNLLQRSPDPEGFASHVAFLKKGGEPSLVYDGFIKSEEYRNLGGRKSALVKEDDLDKTILPFKDINAAGFGLDMVLESSRTHFSDPLFISGMGNLPSLVGRRKKKVETIALYYHKLRSGGIERVTAWQANAWTGMGYRVILITDEPAHPDDYSYDPGVQRVVIPGKFMRVSDNREYAPRGHALAEILQDAGADLFVTNLGHELCTIWDILVAKSLGIPAILGWHNVFDADFQNGSDLAAAQLRLLGHRYADLTTVLTSMDQAWFTLNGYCARVVPNPPTFAELPEEPASLAGKTLVWVARVERHQKQVHHVLQMMPLVLAEHPDARLLIVGDGPELDWARELARSLGISSRVRFIGHTDDVGAYLQNATLHVMTSQFEGFGLALEEAWSYGLPSVMYAMPYLELVKSGKGHVAVPQGDIHALARAVSNALGNREELHRLGEEARSIAAAYKAQSVADIWRGIFDDIATCDRMGPTIDQLNIPADAQELVRHLSAQLFPAIKPALGLPVARQAAEPRLEKIAKARRKIAGLSKFVPGMGYKPLRMIDLTSIPLGDSFMFFSGLYAMLDNGLPVCAPDCVLHTHKPLVNICRVLFADFGIKVVAGAPTKVEHPFFLPHPPVSNADWRQTYMGSDWRMDWVEATDRQKSIGRPGYRDTLRKMAQLFVSERLIYRRTGGWKTATPSYIGFRVWWPIALKLGVYPVVFYSMVSRSLGEIRHKLHTYIDAEIARDEKLGKAPFRGNAAFPTGNSYQTIDAQTYKHVMNAVGEDAFTCFVQDDSPWREEFVAAGIKTRHIPAIEDTLKIIRSAKSVVTCCSFTSHVAQFLRDDFVLVMFKDFPENNVNPGANPKILTYTPPCSPCNYLPRGQSKTCPAGFPHCTALENPEFRDKIIRELKTLVRNDAR